MKKIKLETSCKRMLADIYTPVGIYLRVRDRFRDTVLLESTDHHVAENSYSFIGINAIAGIEISSSKRIEYKLPGDQPQQISINNPAEVPSELWGFMQRFEMIPPTHKQARFAQGLYGYTTYDAVQFFDSVSLKSSVDNQHADQPLIPLMRYRLYQYIIAINHYKDELFICENIVQGVERDSDVVESLIRGKDVPVYPFRKRGEEISPITDQHYLDMVKKGINSCYEGNVFQIVLSRRFQQQFQGDEFNVYRTLRSVNPSPYLFFFDYGDYKLMGSSPEAQLVINNGLATVHPIAGTFRRTGDDETDHQLAEKLLNDSKENAEHVMLVDLARNDLSRLCDNVKVAHYRQVQYYSHVIHLVSEVVGNVRPGTNPFELLAKTFPAGTLSGAPKFKAMELIDRFESIPRSYYGGGIGFIGFDGSCNHAIMIRTLLSIDNSLIYQAGAGIVAVSNPESELQEVNNKLNALKKAVDLAEELL